MRTAAICPTCATYENALCILYNGPYLSCIGVSPLDSLETALGLIDGAVCLNNAQIATINNTLANMSLQAVTTIGNTTNLGINLTATVANPVSGVTLGGTNNQFSIIGQTYTASFNISGLTANRVITVPNNAGTMALTSDITLQNATAGTNKNLTNGINLQGTGAGGGTFSGTDINAFGGNACFDNSGTSINAMGGGAVQSNTGDNINGFGAEAAKFNTGDYVDAIGYKAAKSNIGDHVIALGFEAGGLNTANDVVAIGRSAGGTNGLASSFIISNNTLPTYADHTAAVAGINLGAGAVAGNTYLYHNQATNSIGAVRL